MKKLCEMLQKFNGIIAIVVFAALAIFALAMATPAANLRGYADTEDFYKAIQPWNDGILYFAIAGIVLACLYSVLRNNVRKIFYISNFVWTILYCLVGLGGGIYAIVGISLYQKSYLALPLESINQYWADHYLDTSVSRSTPVFALGYLAAALVFISVILCAFVGIMKFIDQRKTKPQADSIANKEEAHV
jgi:hypothetical protein